MKDRELRTICDQVGDPDLWHDGRPTEAFGELLPRGGCVEEGLRQAVLEVAARPRHPERQMDA